MGELGSIQIDTGDLTEAVRALADAVRYQGDNIATLMDAAQAEGDTIHRTIPTVKPGDGLYASSFGPVKSTPMLQQHGFGRGDRVVLFNGDGTLRFATASLNAKRYVYAEKIPVDLDNGMTDAWPVKMVLKVDANTQQYIDKINPLPFGKGTPPKDVDRYEWNRAALRLAVDEELVAEFDYQKEENNTWSVESDPKPRRVRPVRMDETSNVDASRQAIVAVDLELPASVPSRFRTFRLDRITNLVHVS